MTETLTATALMSDRSSREVNHGIWKSDNPLVATVDAGGTVTAISAGDATVSVEFSGVRGTTKITVRPDYNGPWAGRYYVVACTDTEEFTTYHVCDAMFPPTSGVRYDVTFALTQTDDAVTGLAAFETIDQKLAPAAIQRDGSLKTTSYLEYSLSPVHVSWTLKQATASRIDGTLIMVWTHPNHPGSMTVTADLENVTHASTTAARTTARGLGWKPLTDIWRR